MSHLLATPHGITLAGVILAKRNADGSFAIKGNEKSIHAQLQAAYGRAVHPQAMRYIQRGCELLAKVSDQELQHAAYPFHPNPDAKTTSGNDFSDLTKGLMMFALTGLNDIENVPEGKARLLKMQGSIHHDSLLKSYGLLTWAQLTKDDGDDEDEDEDDDDDDDNDDSGASTGGGNSHYNPDEPRIPAGQPGGGQWTTAGNGTSTDSGSISADDIRTALREDFDNYNPSALPQGTQVAANDVVQSDVNPTVASTTSATASNGPGTLSHVDNLPLAPNSNALPYFDSSIASQVSGFFNDAQQQGIPVQMTSGFRSSDAQADLTGNQYGGAASGSSLHEAGFAFDVNWSQLSSAQQNQLVDIAQQHNLQWGGTFNTPDPVHFYSDPFSSVAARRAYIPQAQQQYQTLQGGSR